MAFDLDLGWSDFERVGQSRVLRSSVIWVVVTPVVARLFKRVNGVYEVPLVTPPLQIELGLPFSFQAPYVAACCFSLASLIYTAQCPWLISRFESYTHFDHADRRTRESKSLKDFLHRITVALTPDSTSNHFLWTPPVGAKPSRFVRERSLTAFTSRALYRLGVEPQQCPNIFALLRDEMEQQHRGWRRALVALYAVGFALLGVLFVQNAIAVFR